MSFNIQQQHLPIIHSVNTRTARYIPAGFFSGREILPSDTESTRSWNSAGTSACFQRSLSKSRLVRNTKERRLRKWNSSACNSVESRLTLCYSSSLERSAQQLAVAKLKISPFIHSIYHKGQKITLGNKGPYEITATEVMCKYKNFKSFWWTRAKRLDVYYWEGCSQVEWNSLNGCFWRSFGLFVVVVVRFFSVFFFGFVLFVCCCFV